MLLIFGMCVLSIGGGINAQFDDSPSNDGAGWVLAGMGAVGALVSGWFLWGAKLAELVGGAA